MLVDFYTPDTVSADTLLEEGIAANAYLSSAGWKHQGLISLTAKYGLTGSSKDLSTLTMEKAFVALETVLKKGPVMASVHYTFDPKNIIPHLVVITGVANGLVHYNDPAEKAGGGTLSIAKFQSAWKKRYIEIHPVKNT
jgi:Papain-like cysteine protease AvrRpt2